jgi:lipopolysaccharide transport LptD-like protein
VIGAARRGGLLCSLITTAAFSGLAQRAEGQAVPDTVTADSLQQQADSSRLAIFERLDRLNRLPGADSLIYVQDSVRMAEAAGGNRFGAGMDSVATALMAMPGYSLTEYEAESADFDAEERVLVLSAPDGGRARVIQEGLILEADTSITFDQTTGSMRTVGDATFTTPEGDPVDAANMIYDLQQGRGSATGARTSWPMDGAEWRVTGDMPFAAQDSTFMAHAQFTSCEIDDPHYHFETDEIKIVAGNVLVARGVKLYFADVAVAWLPFMAQSLARGRRSGILTPRFSVNDIVSTSSGYRRRISNVGFYWAASEYFDALAAIDWFSETFFSLTGSMRYSFRRQFLDGDLSLRRYWNQDGSTELGIDTRHSWEIDERTQLRISGRFISNNDFVRQNSFNPQEVTQSIDSEAGINRRFGWGSLSLSANRKQFLSDDRTEWLLPSANLSLSPITLFRAPTSEASFYNNMTWSGSGGVRRNTVDRAPPDTLTSLSQADVSTMASFARSNLSVGALTFSQSVDLNQRASMGVPDALLLLGDSADPADLIVGAPVSDVAEATLGWSAGLGYQQQLLGSTTITPRLSLSGSMFRSDTDPLAQNFVSAPSRMSFGAQLKTDIYGFFPGVGPFEAIRHKISPSFDYQWSPASSPSQLQQDVFGSRALQPKNTISLSLTQTFEAKRRSEETDSVTTPTDGSEARPGIDDPLAPGPVGADGLPTDQPGASGRDGASAQGADTGPQRVQTTPSVTLLAWRMSVIRYDFVQADSTGIVLSGFETTRLSNQFSSDYLRGLSISMDHELFLDEIAPDGTLLNRTFNPHLALVNLGFSLGSTSGIFRWLSGGGGDDDAPPPEEPDNSQPLQFDGVTDQSSVVPVSGRDRDVPTRSSGGSSGGWNASLSYSLQRPRLANVQVMSQMLSGTVRLQPTVNWSLSWRTAYDLEAGRFNDHSIRLTRDLHRWQANFDFLQTATGNWTFRFEVSLLDNRDLKFDYNQRNLDLGLPSSQR